MDDPVFLEGLGGSPDPSGEALAVIDARGLVAGWSPGAERLTGFPAEEVVGRAAAELLHDPEEITRFARFHSDRQPYAREPAVLRSRSGTPIDVALRGQLLTLADGVQHWLAVAVRAAAAHRGELLAAFSRALFTESPFIIDMFDTRLRYLARNEASAESTGFPDAEYVGRAMGEVPSVDRMDVAAFTERQRKVLATGEPLLGTEVRTHHPTDPDLDRVWSETILPVRDHDGAVVALAHSVFEVTEQLRARTRLKLVNDANTKIGSSLDVLRTAQELTDVAVPQFADHAYVNLLDPVFGGAEPVAGPLGAGVELRRAGQSTRPGATMGQILRIGEVDAFASGPGSMFAQAMASGRPLLLNGDEVLGTFVHVDQRRAALMRARGVHSWLLVPMSARGAVLGTVVFLRFDREHPFEPDDMLLAQEFVARAAVCIDNASRYTRERTTALALQRSLLPQRLPVLGAVEAASRYLPASGHAALGGDWFDVIPLSGARVALVVGDAVGHGLHSAVAMGRLRTAVRTLADLDLPPDELLTEMDDLVARLQDGRAGGAVGHAAGTTFVYAVFDPITRRCTVARAGHPAPVRVTADGRAEVLDLPEGAALGLGRGRIPFESREVELADGDLLVLYSDGLVGARGQGPGAGAEQLRVALADLAPAGTGPALPGPGEVCDTVIRRLLPEGPQDDVAVLVARLRGLAPDSHVSWELPAEPEVVARARSLVSAQLADWGLAELEFLAELTVSELVTNAIRYGTPPIRLRLIRDRTLICEVEDGSSTAPHVRRALETDEGGRGLYLVSQCVSLWGTRYHPRGKTIWAELELPEEPAGAAEPEPVGGGPAAGEPVAGEAGAGEPGEAGPGETGPGETGPAGGGTRTSPAGNAPTGSGQVPESSSCSPSCP